MPGGNDLIYLCCHFSLGHTCEPLRRVGVHEICRVKLNLLVHELQRADCRADRACDHLMIGLERLPRKLEGIAVLTNCSHREQPPRTRPPLLWTLDWREGLSVEHHSILIECRQHNVLPSLGHKEPVVHVLQPPRRIRVRNCKCDVRISFEFWAGAVHCPAILSSRRKNQRLVALQVHRCELERLAELSDRSHHHVAITLQGRRCLS